MIFRTTKFALIGGTILMASVGLTPAVAQGPVEQREAAMKDVGKATKTLGDMVKGEAAFDAAAANAALASMQQATAGFGDLFPDGTELQGSNEDAAGPKIWQDMAGFQKAVADFDADIAAAVASSPQDLDALKAAFGGVAENCKTCHEAYRVKR